MNKLRIFFIYFLSILPLFSLNSAYAHRHNWYISWGYNKDYWSNSDIHISQPSLGNHFTVEGVSASDYPGWDKNIFDEDMMSPQYNIRIGWFFNGTHTWALELNFDHTKYNNNSGQTAFVTGTVNGRPINEYQVLTKNYFNYMLHNGLNNLMVNIVRRKPFFRIPHTSLHLAGLIKAGAGVLLPHPINTIMGNTVDVGPKASGNYFGWRNGWWQMGGWTAGVEFGLQLTLYKTLYTELTDKETYNSLSDIQVYSGRAAQNVWMNEMILSLGTTL